jgi:hypothetical protein
MASGTLTPAGKIKLQETFSQIGTRLFLKGTEAVFGEPVRPLDVGVQNGYISWESADATNGLKLSGIVTYGVGCSTLVTPRIVQGIESKTVQGQLLLTEDFPANQQATYTFADDGQNGRYTVTEITINFS